MEGVSLTHFADRPMGMRDGYPDFAKRRRQIETELLSFFDSHEFQMVSSGAFEYVETLLRARPAYEAENWIQLFDGSGKAIALRPEVTPSIVRMAAPLVAAGKTPIRWCYAERVYRRTNDPASLSWASGKAAESTQVGVEWIGAKGIQVDVSVLELCQNAMSHLQLSDAQIVVSHAVFAPAFLLAVGMPERTIEGLLELLTKGDYVGFRQSILEQGVNVDVLKALQCFDPFIPETIDGVVPSVWQETSAGERAMAAWNHLVELAAELSSRGLNDEISFDLTLHRDITYYTGIVFEAFAPGVGAPILLGGRYDDLLAQYGAPSPAIGFTFELERVLAVLSEESWLNSVSEGGNI